jgi:hypothetical protein
METDFCAIGSDSHAVCHITHCCPHHHIPNINCIIHKLLSSLATDIRFIHGGQCECGHYAISVEEKAICCPAQELSVLHLLAGWAPVQPCNDVYTHFMADGELCD